VLSLQRILNAYIKHISLSKALLVIGYSRKLSKHNLK